MKINEFLTQEDLDILDEKASKKLCRSKTPDSKLGASNLASCVAQGLRAHSTKKAIKIGKKKVRLDGKKIASTKYNASGYTSYGEKSD